MSQQTCPHMNSCWSYPASCGMPARVGSTASECCSDILLTALAPQAPFCLHGLFRGALAMSMVAVDDALWESVLANGALWLVGPLKKPSRWFYLLGNSLG